MREDCLSKAVDREELVSPAHRCRNIDVEMVRREVSLLIVLSCFNHTATILFLLDRILVSEDHVGAFPEALFRSGIRGNTSVQLESDESD